MAFSMHHLWNDDNNYDYSNNNYRFRPNIITELVNYLNPKNCSIIMCCNKLCVTPSVPSSPSNSVEWDQYYNIHYIIEPFSEEFLYDLCYSCGAGDCSSIKMRLPPAPSSKIKYWKNDEDEMFNIKKLPNSGSNGFNSYRSSIGNENDYPCVISRANNNCKTKLKVWYYKNVAYRPRDLMFYAIQVSK